QYCVLRFRRRTVLPPGLVEESWKRLYSARLHHRFSKPSVWQPPLKARVLPYGVFCDSSKTRLYLSSRESGGPLMKNCLARKRFILTLCFTLVLTSFSPLSLLAQDNGGQKPNYELAS